MTQIRTSSYINVLASFFSFSFFFFIFGCQHWRFILLYFVFSHFSNTHFTWRIYCFAKTCLGKVLFPYLFRFSCEELALFSLFSLPFLARAMPSILLLPLLYFRNVALILILGSFCLSAKQTHTEYRIHTHTLFLMTPISFRIYILFMSFFVSLANCQNYRPPTHVHAVVVALLMVGWCFLFFSCAPILFDEPFHLLA